MERCGSRKREVCPWKRWGRNRKEEEEDGGGGCSRQSTRREECCKNMAPDEGDNVMRVTKVDVPREEKGLALDNEGLLYGCHGDERVSQASSFL